MNSTIAVILSFVVFMLVAYLLGSVNFAIITTKLFTGSDVRDSGSGNAGMTNVMRTAGFLPGIITFGGDFLKAVVAGCLARFAFVPFVNLLATTGTVDQTFLDAAPMLCTAIMGFCCLLGHVYPVFFGFKGGKGIVTAAGTMLILDWKLLTIELAIFFIFFLSSRIISLGSIACAVCYPFVMFFLSTHWAKVNSLEGWFPYAMTAIVLALAVLVLIKHKGNIVRLIKREEPKLNLKKQKK